MGNQSTKHHLRSSGDAVGGLKQKKFVHWKSAERPLPPGRPILIPLSDQQPDVITLKWNRPISDGGSPILGYMVEHRRTGSPHWVRATPSLVPRPEVSISGLEPGWRYQFRVIAENVVGKSDPSELSDPLTVTLQRSAISVPRFVTELQDTVAVENDRIELPVSVIGHPTPEINWFKDGFEIFSSRRTKIVNENDSSALIIHQAAFTDEGEIKCTATNRAGHVVTRARLSIEAPPKIRLPRQYEDGLIFEAEEVVRLKVGIAGQPAPSVVWTHEGAPIINSGRFEIVTTDKNSSLKIANIKRTDRGEYSLRASNKLGEDIASFLVTVTSKPNPPGKVKLQMSFGRSATLTWEAPNDDGGCKIGNYIIEYFRIGWNVWLKAATTRKQTVTLHDLIEGSEYKFRVKAENPYGLSDPSEQSEVLFIPDPTRGITKPIQSENPAANGKPVPPKRKNLSPLRNFLGKKNVQDASPNHQPSPSRNASLMSEAYDSEDIKREMSYGTSNDLLTSKGNLRKVDAATEAKFPTSPQSQRNTSNQQASRGSPPTLKREGINQKLQYFLRLSPRTARKSREQNQAVSPGPSPTNSIRSNQNSSPIQYRAKNASAIGEANSPARSTPSPLKGNQQMDLRLAPEISFESTQPSYQRLGDNFGQGDWMQAHRRSLVVPGEDEEPEGINVNALKGPRLSLPNPRIEISPVKPEYSIPQSPANASEMHTSSEFMLVLYSNKDSQEHSKQDSFELDLEESLMHPPLSLSSPDLSSGLQYLQELQLRRSASSTELLYERAMARFYEAVELEEAEKAKRRRVSQDTTQSGQVNLTVRKRLGSMTEAERLSFERRSNLRRRVSGDMTQPLAGNFPSKWDSKDCLNLIGDAHNEKQLMRNNDSLESEDSVNMLESEDRGEFSSGSDYDEDYTESTASSDSIEKFKIEMMARTQPANAELETYHPRVMDSESGTFSPYRLPEPDQASLVLVKPLPLPNPDFVPKPILKRPSIDNNINEDKEVPAIVLDIEVPKPEKSPKPETKSRSFKSFFKRDKGKSSETNSPKEHSPKEPSPKKTSSKGTSPKELSPNQLSPPISPPISPPMSPPLTPSPESSQRNSLSPRELSPFRSFAGRFSSKSPKSLSPKELSPKEMSPKELSPSANDKKLTTQEKIEAFVQKQGEINERINRQREELMRRKLESTKSAEEETRVVVDHYSHIVNEMGTSRKDKVPLYLSGDDLIKAAKKAEDEEESRHNSNELNPQVSSKPRLSIVERLQTAHVQEKSKSALEQAKSITGESQDDDQKSAESHPEQQPGTEEQPRARGRSGPSPRRFKRRTPSGSRTRDASALKIGEKPTVSTELPAAAPTKRNVSRSRTRNISKSPGAINRRPLKRDPTPDIRLPIFTIPPPLQIEGRPQTPEEMSEEAQEKIRSTVSYATDVGLFVVACWVYLFKDARLVIPILALMVYRQVSEMIRDRIPNWVPRKKS